MRDPYLVLGVKRTASPDEIKAAWRALAKSIHPDRNHSDPNAHSRFAEAGQAYQLLKDPQKRYRYDMERRMAEEARRGGTRKAQAGGTAQKQRPSAGPTNQTGQAKAQGAGPDDFFSRMFTRKPAQPGERSHFSDKDTSATETLSGIFRKFGGGQPSTEKAPDLHIDVPLTIEDILLRNHPRITLPDGRSIKINLPDEVTDGLAYRLAGQGHRIASMQRGDLVATFRILPHKLFRAVGTDLYVDLPVDIENAVLGCETIADTPDGPIRVKVPEWTGSNKAIVISGKGLPKADGSRGDLHAQIRVMLWDHPDDKVKDLMRSLREGLFL